MIIEEAIISKNQKYPDNFQDILPIFPYTLDKDTASGNLNTAILKLKTVIGSHRASDWVDDSYFMIGKVQFLKNDFEEAENTFRWVTQEFSPEKIRKAKEKGMSSKQRKKSSRKKREMT